MMPSGRSQAVVAGALATATVVVILAAAPAASTGARSPRVPMRATGALAASSATLLDPSPLEEATLMVAAADQRRHDAWLARLRAWKHKQESRASASGISSVPSGSVRDLVVSLFTRIAGPGQVGAALCVAGRESDFDPFARNPYSSAAGVFQWIASSWSSYSARYGFGGSSVFDAYANVAVAAHAVADGGWGPWGGGCW